VLLSFLMMMSACQNESEHEVLSSDQLLIELNSHERLVSPEEVAAKLIENDPSQLLVDVRDHTEYDAFTLPGAINVPLKRILEQENQNILDCSRYTLVFFSNDDLIATEAWTLNRLAGCQGALVMQGGLNLWTQNLLTPAQPEETAPEEEWELYRLRKAIAQYLIGGSEELAPEDFPVVKKVVAPKKAIAVQPKPKKKAIVEEEEGC
jgi:rhodanese-related sulfurtransferase